MKKNKVPPSATSTFKELVLMRHGCHMNGELTEYGRFQVESVATQLVEDRKIGPIYSSPTLRAYQSALIIKDIFGKATGGDVSLHVVPWLECDRRYRGEIATEIDPNNCLIIAISHQPNIEEMTSQFAKFVSPEEAEARVYKRNSWRDFKRPDGEVKLFTPAPYNPIPEENVSREEVPLAVAKPAPSLLTAHDDDHPIPF